MAYWEEAKGIYTCSACKSVATENSTYCPTCGKKLNFIIHDYEIDSLNMVELIGEQGSVG